MELGESTNTLQMLLIPLKLQIQVHLKQLPEFSKVSNWIVIWETAKAAAGLQ